MVFYCYFLDDAYSNPLAPHGHSKQITEDESG